MEALVKTLNGVINDNTLPKFNVLQLPVNSGSMGQYGEIRIVANKIIKVSANGGFIGYNATMVANETTEFEGSTFNIFCSTNGFSIEIEDEYEIIKFLQFTSRVDITTEQLKYLRYIKGLALKASATGELANLAELTELIELDLASSNIIGNIEDIGSLNKLTRLNLGYTGTRIRGSLEEFVKRQYVSRGNQAGNIVLNLVGNSQVTFNGVSVPANDTVSWIVNSSDSSKLNITFNGTTVIVSIA